MSSQPWLCITSTLGRREAIAGIVMSPLMSLILPSREHSDPCTGSRLGSQQVYYCFSSYIHGRPTQMFTYAEGIGQCFICFSYHYNGLIPQKIPGKRRDRNVSIENLPIHLVCTCVRVCFVLFSVFPYIQRSLFTIETHITNLMTSLALCHLVLDWVLGPWPMVGYFSKFSLFISKQKVGLFGEVSPKKKNKIHNHQCRGFLPLPLCVQTDLQL